MTDGAVIRMWRAQWISFPVISYVCGLIAGIVTLVLAPSVLTSTQRDYTTGGVMFIIVGIGFLVECGFCLIAPAFRVEELGGGHFIFYARRRTLTVAPGAVRSVRCVWMDPNRLIPMRLRSTSGSIFIAPRMNDMEGLYKALSDANPEAVITSPLSITSRGLIPRDLSAHRPGDWARRVGFQL
ncbi:MAG TPA: hypothetical protein VND70_06040 [Acidimicrobiales bacterium]|nr:hypothetical protein [Acidimicrobiales bacterium]